MQAARYITRENEGEFSEQKQNLHRLILGKSETHVDNVAFATQLIL